MTMVDFKAILEREESISIFLWSLKLGLVELDLKKDQPLIKGMVKKLQKMQRYDAPSHVIMKQRVKGDENEEHKLITIFRLTHDQEYVIEETHLWPADLKRQEGIIASYERSFAVDNR